jgi:hypothetical protein
MIVYWQLNSDLVERSVGSIALLGSKTQRSDNNTRTGRTKCWQMSKKSKRHKFDNTHCASSTALVV